MVKGEKISSKNVEIILKMRKLRKIREIRFIIKKSNR